MTNSLSIEIKEYEENPYSKFIEDISNVLIKYFNNSQTNYLPYHDKYGIDKVNGDNSHYVEVQCCRFSNRWGYKNLIYARKIKYLLYKNVSLIHYIEADELDSCNENFDIYSNEIKFVVCYLPNMYDILDTNWIFVDKINGYQMMEEYKLKYKKLVKTRIFKKDQEKSRYIKNLTKYFDVYKNDILLTDINEISKVFQKAAYLKCEIATQILKLPNIKYHELSIRFDKYNDFIIDKKNIKNDDIIYIKKCYKIFLSEQYKKLINNINNQMYNTIKQKKEAKLIKQIYDNMYNI